MQRGLAGVSVLKIDKDCWVEPDWIDDYVGLVKATCRKYRVTVISIRMSRSRRKGIHFYIEIAPPIDAKTANRLQWLLGDDSSRVDFNRARIDSGLNEWNKLFEEPGRRLRRIYAL